MKKIIYLLLIMVILTFTGCSKPDKMANFIPTQAPEENTAEEEISPTGVEENSEVTPTPKEIHVGQTVKKYVKLNEYDDILNVRSTPSTEQDPVGFLVHTEEIQVIDIVDGWASFVYNNAICYVNADYLVDERPEYLPPPTPTPAPKNTPTPVPNQSTPNI